MTPAEIYLYCTEQRKKENDTLTFWATMIFGPPKASYTEAYANTEAFKKLLEKQKHEQG